ncbi:MAG: DUF4236 domain-containing protein [Acidobacteriota bacterium]|jgi:hypothetical protein
MGLRFRRTVKILPGVHLHISKSGVSASLGRRGASLNVGPRGKYLTLGLPGTGISYREKLQEHHEVAPHVQGPELPWILILVILAALVLILSLIWRG